MDSLNTLINEEITGATLTVYDALWENSRFHKCAIHRFSNTDDHSSTLKDCRFFGCTWFIDGKEVTLGEWLAGCEVIDLSLPTGKDTDHD